MKVGDHILTLKRIDVTKGSYWNASCSTCKWNLRRVDGATARTAHREHVDAMAERERQASDAR